MNNNIYKDKLILINDAFLSRNFDTVVQESCKIFEAIMKKLYVEALGKVDSNSRKMMMEAEYDNEKKTGIDSFSFGQVIGLYNKCKFFNIIEKQTQRDYSMLRNINFELINQLRIASAHQVKGQEITYENAEYVFSNLKIFLATLGYAEFEKSIEELFSKRTVNPSIKTKEYNTSERIDNKYDVLDKAEKRRIAFQRQLTRETDESIIKHLLVNRNEITILDVGCNNGELIHDRTKNINNINYIFGVDCNEQMISDNISNNNDDKMVYICSDCENEGFVYEIQNEMEEKGFSGFDLIVLSMVLLHVKNPYKVLKNVRCLLKKGGHLYIRDMDDGLTVAYPDNNDLVSRILDISNRVPYTGFRHCGRQIFSYLKKSGFTNIKIHNEIIDTVNMDFDQRSMLFTINFQYIKGDLKLAYNNNPSEFEDDYNWFQTAYDELEELFQLEEFYYRMGTIIFSAER